MSDTLFVLKIGGHVLARAEVLADVLDQFARREGPKILIHGGGKRASQIGNALGIPAQLHKGRRITDADTLEVVTMVYAGLYNKRLVAELQARSCNALGMSGADANSIRAHKRTGTAIDYGYVGDIDAVDAEGIDRLLVAGFTPVFCAITHDQQGQLLNTNADTIAATLAAAFAKEYSVHLQFCFERPGVLRDAERDDSLIPTMTWGDYQTYRDQGIIHSGMLPKLENAFAALRAGVNNVEVSSHAAIGTFTGTTLHL